MTRPVQRCPGCQHTADGNRLCGWCRAAVIEMRPAREMHIDDLLARLRGLVEQWASPDGLTLRDADQLVTAVHELDQRAAAGKLPAEWMWPEGDAPEPYVRDVTDVPLPPEPGAQRSAI